MGFFGVCEVLDLCADSIQKLSDAVVDRTIVKGATHQFYRYPARFSPQFAKAFIKQFTQSGDLVVDPFVGGGTTLVEALRLGRRAVGVDINSLAAFITEVKTTRLTKKDLSTLVNWFEGIQNKLCLGVKINCHRDWYEAGYFKNISGPETWRYQKLLQIAIDKTTSLPNQRTSNFARCVILRTAQLALDGKKDIPPISVFRNNLKKNFTQMIEDISAISALVNYGQDKRNIKVVNTSAANIHKERIFKKTGAPKLILTSPPYPGVHVLYHRWQVRGRRETAAPYWIANKLDGDGERYYTLGNRHEKELKGYYGNLKTTFDSIAKIVDETTLIVQMVAFSKPAWQLPKYLEVMAQCGLAEILLKGSERIWRNVPNRKWHAQLQTSRSASREVVLFHKLK